MDDIKKAIIELINRIDRKDLLICIFEFISELLS
jgi:hypothetical protein